jgi:hypothetical protein
MKIGIQINESSQVVNYCSEEHYTQELAEIINRDYPLGLIDIGEQNPEDLILKYYIDGAFYEQSLEEKRAEKLTALQNDFNASKKITIQNGNTLIIEHDTPERDILLNSLEKIEVLQNMLAFIYTQEDADLGFRVLPEIFQYIFKDLFIASLPNGTKVNSRVHNKAVIFSLKQKLINQATTIEEINNINWQFVNPNGVIVNINEKANQMLVDTSVSEEAKNAINLVKDENDEIHLIKTINELEL